MSSDGNGKPSVMHEILTKLIGDAPKNQDGLQFAEVQVTFRVSTVVPTIKGPVASNSSAGVLAFGPVPGSFKLLTQGEGPDKQRILIEILFDGEAVARVDRMAGTLEAPRIVPVGGLIAP